MLQAMSYASLVNQKLCQCSLNIAQAVTVLQALVATSNCKFPELKPEMNYCSGKIQLVTGLANTDPRGRKI